MTGKIKLWLPVLALIAAVRFFSSQPAGSPVLERFPLPFQLGHFIGYALLGFFLYRALAGGLSHWKGSAARGTIIITLLYAIFDEYFQGFVPGRTPSATDVLIDMAGVLTALLLCRGLFYLRDVHTGTAPVVKTREDNLEAAVKAGAVEKATLEPGLQPGGALLYFAVVVVVLYIFPFSHKFFIFLFTATLIMITGLFDRNLRFNFWLQFLGQAAAAMMLVFGNRFVFEGIVSYLSRWNIPFTAVLLLAAVWVILVTNSFSISGGFDGAALAVVGVLAGLLLLLSQLNIRYLPPASILVLLGAAAGVFSFNIRGGPVPLGTTGGALFGFSLAAFLLFTPGTPFFYIGIFCSLFMFMFPYAEIMTALSGQITLIVAGSQNRRGGWDASKQRFLTKAFYLLYLSAALAGTLFLTRHGLPAPVYLAALLSFMALPGAVNILRKITLSGRLRVPPYQ